jgi:hypothetical protein
MARRRNKPRRARKAGARRPVARKPVARKRRRPSAKPDPLDAFISAGVRALGLEIEAAWMPSVRTHLAVSLRHAGLVAGQALPDDAEPAPVFKA